MARHAKTEQIINAACQVLTEYNPMTVRQVYYQLVSKQIIDNTRSQYQAVSKALVAARKEGAIPWDWLEDRLRLPRSVKMWDNLGDFARMAEKAYRRDVWETQPDYLEAWLEKDALSGIFLEVLKPYGVTLNVGRGYDGWDSIYNAAQRYDAGDGVTILYFGDLDPSGDDMVRSLAERLRHFGCYPEIIKCALNPDDVTRYNLPPDPTKKTDSRRAAFVEKYGDLSVELDALPVNVLATRLKKEVEKRLDLAALEAIKTTEKAERQQLVSALGGVA